MHLPTLMPLVCARLAGPESLGDGGGVWGRSRSLGEESRVRLPLSESRGWSTMGHGSCSASLPGAWDASRWFMAKGKTEESNYL